MAFRRLVAVKKFLFMFWALSINEKRSSFKRSHISSDGRSIFPKFVDGVNGKNLEDEIQK